MTWQIKDEFIDLCRARHTVIFHNPDTGAEHHLVHEFKLASCPHCGTLKANAAGIVIDMETKKAETLTALHAHHNEVMQYREKHPRVRIGSAPK